MSWTRGSSRDRFWNSGCSLTPTIPLSFNDVTFSSTLSSGWTVPIGTSRSRGTDPMNSLVRATVDALIPTPRASPLSMPASSMVREQPGQGAVEPQRHPRRTLRLHGLRDAVRPHVHVAVDDHC